MRTFQERDSCFAVSKRHSFWCIFFLLRKITESLRRFFFVNNFDKVFVIDFVQVHFIQIMWLDSMCGRITFDFDRWKEIDYKTFNWLQLWECEKRRHEDTIWVQHLVWNWLCMDRRLNVHLLLFFCYIFQNCWQNIMVDMKKCINGLRVRNPMSGCKFIKFNGILHDALFHRSLE